MAYYYVGFDGEVKHTDQLPKTASAGAGLNPPSNNPSSGIRGEEGSMDYLLSKLVSLLKLVDEKITTIMEQINYADNLLTIYEQTQNQKDYDQITRMKKNLEKEITEDGILCSCRRWAEETVEDLTDLDLSEISYDQIMEENMKSTIRGSYDEIIKEVDRRYVDVSSFYTQKTSDTLDFYYEKTRFESRLEQVKALQEEIRELAKHAQEIGHTRSYEQLTSMNHNIEEAVSQASPAPDIALDTYEKLIDLRHGVASLEAIIQIYPRSVDTIRYEMDSFEISKNAMASFLNDTPKKM